MMKTNLNFLLISILSIFITVSACNTEGPTGPQGEPGPQGEQGPQGTPGEDGEDGTANVIYSEWLDLDWNLTDEPDYKAMIIEDENATADFRDNGALLMYYKIVDGGGTTGIFLMPIVDNTTRFDNLLVVNEGAGIDGIAVRYYRTSGTDPLPELDGQIRYMLLPGGIPAKMSMDFLKDYSSVKEYYGIPD